MGKATNARECNPPFTRLQWLGERDCSKRMSGTRRRKAKDGNESLSDAVKSNAYRSRLSLGEIVISRKINKRL